MSNEVGHAYQEVPVIPRESVYLGCDLLEPPDDLAVDLVIVLTIKRCVVNSGDTHLGRVDINWCSDGIVRHAGRLYRVVPGIESRTSVAARAWTQLR
jgi:hypothetical protein